MCTPDFWCAIFCPPEVLTDDQVRTAYDYYLDHPNDNYANYYRLFVNAFNFNFKHIWTYTCILSLSLYIYIHTCIIHIYIYTYVYIYIYI